MTRAYIRLDPGYFESRLERGDPPGAVAAYIGVLCLAEVQPTRGRFRNAAILKALLTPQFGRWVPYMLAHGDLVPEGNRLYVDGWDEWQEGDWKVGERVARIRKRRDVTDDAVADVTLDAVADVTVATVVSPLGAGAGAGGSTTPTSLFKAGVRRTREENDKEEGSGAKAEADSISNSEESEEELLGLATSWRDGTQPEPELPA